eukprot:CAMPEP_0197845944 /NCGR_PEP_ID=MMETSP1438-20131217/2793_1 /TAXON_ID=1461541 /ORGANISM="Pterosperma sp., Strain CCMP1384" /LENGTH=744 /DNA_ID=CAMNT_0043457421 /DNA_START=250 /DNA_END=2484 /DNA_ORIENTATION=+
MMCTVCGLFTLITPIHTLGYQANAFAPQWSTSLPLWQEFSPLHLAPFFIGVLIAIHRLYILSYLPSNALVSTGLCMLPLLAGVLYLTPLIDHDYTNTYSGALILWAGHGGLLPLFMPLVFGMSIPRNLVAQALGFVPAGMGDLSLCYLMICFAGEAIADQLMDDPNTVQSVLMMMSITCIVFHTVYRFAAYLANHLVEQLAQRANLENKADQEKQGLIKSPSKDTLDDSDPDGHPDAKSVSLLTSWLDATGLSYPAAVIGYYTLMVFFPGYLLWRSEHGARWLGFVDVTGAWQEPFVRGAKWLVLLSLPAALVNFIGQSVWPTCVRRSIPDNKDMLQDSTDFKLYFRIVTRGDNPMLVLRNAERVAQALFASLPQHKWEVEVLSDAHLNIDGKTKYPITELVVPDDYQPPGGARFKARALQYAVEHSKAGAGDWIVHLDEETWFHTITVSHVYRHCLREYHAVKDGIQKYGRIGQGGIIYAEKGGALVSNWVTTLADSIRVADDCGKFRFQFEMGCCWGGMHGSYVVIHNAVEKDIGFDHGLAGNITEDTHFALVARDHGVGYAWIDAWMCEQSPFTIMDFIKQRRRWFGGLRLVCLDTMITFKTRIWLILFTWAWALQPVGLVGVVATWTVSCPVSDSWRYIACMITGSWYWCYTLGFIKTYHLKDGYVRYGILLTLQLALLPVFMLMECAGVIYAMYHPPVDDFFVIQKEPAQGMEPEQATTSKAGDQEHQGYGTETASTSV